MGEEFSRYGSKVVQGLDRLKGALGARSKQLGEALKAGAAELKEDAAAVAADLKQDASAAAAALKEDGKRGVEWLKGTGVPKAKEKIGQAAEVVATHADLTGRRIAAEVREVVSDPEILEKDKAHNFELTNMVFNRRVSLVAPLRNFLDSEHAQLKGFDNSGAVLRGIPLYPQQNALAHLEDEFVPVRIYVTTGGLVARTYKQNTPEEVCAGQPQYSFVNERKANADDLFQVRVTPDQLEGALGEIRKSAAYGAFRQGQ